MHAIHTKKIQFIILIILFITFSYFFNESSPYIFNKSTNKISFEKAKVLAILDEYLTPYPNIPHLYTGTQTIEVKVLSGSNKNEVYQIQNTLSPLYNIYVKKGMTIIVSKDLTGQQMIPLSVYSYYRAPLLYLLTTLFFFLLIVLGGKKGIKAILGLLLTLGSILWLFIPMLFKGVSPIVAALIITIFTTLITLYLLNGWHIKTAAASLGTLLGLISSGILSYFCSQWAHVSALNTPESEPLLYIATDTPLQLEGLLFAGILIAALGAVMDVGMSITSSMYELFIHQPKLTRKELFLAGMSIGKDMMGTMSNTLILAFTGGSLTTLVLLYTYQMPYHQLMNIDFLSMEFIQGICGSIGIVLTVPFTACITTLLLYPKNK